MNQKFIVIDGKTYKSVAEMPEDVRKSYEAAMRSLDQNQNGKLDMLENSNLLADKNNNGIPDVFEGLTSLQGSSINVTNATKVIVNGQVYDSLEQLPPEVRAKYQQAMSAMDANGNGVPDFMEGMLNIPSQKTNQTAVNFGTSTPPRSQPIATGSTIEPESSGGWLLALTGILFIGLCLVVAAIGVWYYFLR